MRSLQARPLNSKPTQVQRRIQSVLKFKSLKHKNPVGFHQSQDLSKDRKVYISPQFKSQLPIRKSKSVQKQEVVRFPVVQKKQNLDMNALIVRPRNQTEPNLELTNYHQLKKIQTIAGINPKINSIKFKHLRKSIKNAHFSGKKDTHFRQREFINDKMRKTMDKIKINLSCQKIAPLDNQDHRQGVNKSSTSHKTGGRYKEIPPQQFLYEDSPSHLTKGLVIKLGEMMRKGQRYPKPTYFQY